MRDEVPDVAPLVDRPRPGLPKPTPVVETFAPPPVVPPPALWAPPVVVAPAEVRTGAVTPAGALPVPEGFPIPVVRVGEPVVLPAPEVVPGAVVGLLVIPMPVPVGDVMLLAGVVLLVAVVPPVVSVKAELRELVEPAIVPPVGEGPLLPGMGMP